MIRTYRLGKLHEITLLLSFVSAFVFGFLGVSAAYDEGSSEDDPQAMQVAKDIAEKRPKSPAIDLNMSMKEIIPRPSLPEGSILIREVSIVGSTLLAQESIDELKVKYENRELTAKDLQRCADLVTRAYNREGYITSYGYIIPDKLASGILEIAVKEGKTGKIVIQGNTHFSTDLLRKKISLREGQPFNFRELNLDIFRTNRSQDRKISVALDMDKTTGVTDVTLTVKDKLPFHVTLQADNYGSESILYNRYKMFLTHNNVSGHDDTLTAKIEWAEGDSHKIYDLDYTIPLNNKWKFQLYVLPYKSEDYYYKDNEDTDFEKRARKFYFWFYQSLVNEPDLEIVSSYGFTYFDIFWYKPYDEYMERTRRDSFRILKWDLSFNRSDSYGRWVITNDLQKAIPRMWGGAPSKSDESSVVGAKGDYIKNMLTVARRQKLGNGVDFIAKGRWQLSSATLTGVNAFSTGGYCGVIDNRGFPRTQAPADSGRAVNLGFTFPAYFVPKDVKIPFSKTKLYDSLKLFTFWDWSQAILKSPKVASFAGDPNDKKITTLRSIGLGLTFTVPDQNLAVRVECGFPLSHQTPKDGDHTHTWFSVTKGF